MKTKLTLVLGLLATTLCPPAFAQTTAFTYQGRFNTTNWQPLADITLATSSGRVFDPGSRGIATRFYRGRTSF